MEIDIRSQNFGKVDCIRFGDEPNNTILDNGHDGILFENIERTIAGRIFVKKTDIQNLILALEKAKELWS